MLTLDQTKLHLRIDHDDEDDLITGLMTAATAAVGNHLDNPAVVLDATAPAAPLKSAALLLIADLYENRTSQVERPLHANETFDRLLQPYRVMV